MNYPIKVENFYLICICEEAWLEQIEFFVKNINDDLIM